MIKNQFPLVAFLLLFLGTLPTEELTNPHQTPAVQQKMDSLVAANGIMGFNFSIIYADGNQQDYSSGYANQLTRKPLSVKDKFLSGSIGKTYAAAILFRLVDEGKLTLDDRFRKHFPDVPWLAKVPNIEEVTVRQLLQHTSGLPRWVLKPEVWETLYKEPDKVWTYADRLSYIFGDPPVHEPGKGWAYSDSNYLLIGMLIEKITGKPYYQTLRSWILDPENLTETLPSNQRNIDGLVMAYSRLPETFQIGGEVLVDGSYIFNPQVEWTGGGMASTTSDLAKWAKLYYEGELFSLELLKQVVTVNPQSKKEMGQTPYGMASFIYSTKLGEAYGHSGFMPGYNSIFAYYPQQKVAVALQSNCDFAGTKTSLAGYLEVLVPTALAVNE